MTYTVYIDSDGVIADFDRKAVELLGGRRIPDVPKGTLWATIERHGSFFESLELMPGARRLIDYIEQNFSDYAILTATGYTPKDAAAQKRRWYARHFPNLQVHIVDKSPDKAAMFAGYRTILIDDRAKSIDPWVAAGGIGILHTSVEDTIAQLAQYTDEPDWEESWQSSDEEY